MTVTRRYLLKSTAAIAGASAFPGWAGKAFAAPTKWDMSDEYGRVGVTGQASLFFIDEVNKRIGDQLAITYQGGGALGYKSIDHFDAVQDGAVQMAISLMTQYGGVDPLFDMSSLPFLVQTPDEALKLWRIAKPEYAKIFDDHNMVLLWAAPNPPSGIHAKTPIDRPEALKGLRIRTYDVNGTQTFIAAGASPLQISWSDLVPQLSTGGVNAVLSSADGGVQLSIWDYLKSFTEINYAMGLFMAHVNKDAYESLSKEAQQTLQDICQKVDEFSWNFMKASIEKSYGIMRERGMTIVQNPPQPVFVELRAAGGKVKEAWLKKVGDRGERILAEFEKSKA
ncbi:TRAP transporter substrate-binding protein [Microvirga arabica]|uniref:TRAP transporter substrate-binding protein n=1 Tax=Microvirga arabica TaxID=1128671 RepID=UPI00193A3EF8|nr:TRAP transporter substrate-binding protein [Microvirga arabica]MBM1172393.1 TRAP transporter substrate-binding protein [Microvirga arabica]